MMSVMGRNETLSRPFSKRMREIVFQITFRFFRESDKVGLVKEYPLDADANEDDVDGPLNDDGPALADTGSSAFASASLSSPHTS